MGDPRLVSVAQMQARASRRKYCKSPVTKYSHRHPSPLTFVGQDACETRVYLVLPAGMNEEQNLRAFLLDGVGFFIFSQGTWSYSLMLVVVLLQSSAFLHRDFSKVLSSNARMKQDRVPTVRLSCFWTMPVLFLRISSLHCPSFLFLSLLALRADSPRQDKARDPSHIYSKCF